MNKSSKLIEVLQQKPKAQGIYELIKSVEEENENFVDIRKQLDQLKGVWELRWSTSKSKILNYSPLFDNLQILDPDKSRGLNLLRPKGFSRNFFSTNILAKLDIIDQKRINVTFEKVGVTGPELLGKKISFLTEIKKTQKGWLDITVLTNKLRICRGYKGTTFALLKRDDQSITDFLGQFNS